MRPLPVHVLHEYGDERHFVAHRHLEREGRITLSNSEFNFLTQPWRLLQPSRPRIRRRALHNARTLRRLLSEEDRTIIVGAAPYDPIIPILRRLKRRHRVVYYTSWEVWTREAKMPKRALLPSHREQWFDFLDGLDTVAVTKTAESSAARAGARARRIPHCVDVHTFSPAEHPPEGPRVVLFVGRMEPFKGVGTLEEVIRSRTWPDTEFWFVGSGSLDARIRKLAEDHPVRHLGRISDAAALADVYRQSSLLVLPSEFEAFGIVLIEAMASGIPAVTTTAVGPSEIVEDGVTGRLVPPGDADALRGVLEGLLDDDELRQRLGGNGREEATRTYSVEAVAERWWDVLNPAKT